VFIWLLKTWSSGPGFFTIITTSNITLQDIEKNKSLTATARTAEFRGLKLPVLKGGASR